MLLIENNVRVRHGRKWKERWGVLKKLSPVANAPSLILYKDSSKTQEKATILLGNYYGVWEGWGSVEGEEHLLSIITPEPILLSFTSEMTLKSWSSKITTCLEPCSAFQVSISGDGLPMRKKSDSRLQLSLSSKKEHLFFITTQHVTLTTGFPLLEHLFSWQHSDITEIKYDDNLKQVRFSINNKRTGFYWVSMNTPQASELHTELLRGSKHYWKLPKSPKQLNFPVQANSLSSTASDLMFSMPLHRQLVQHNLRKLSMPLKPRFMKARNSSFQGSESAPVDGLMRHHSDYNLPSNSSLRKSSNSLLRKVHHSSDEIQDNDANRVNFNALNDQTHPSSNGVFSSNDMSASVTSHNGFSNGITRHKYNGARREHRSSTHSSHFSRDTEKANLPPKRYSLNRLKGTRPETYSLNSSLAREKKPCEEPMTQSLLEDSDRTASSYSATNNGIFSNQVFDPHRPLPYTDLSRYDGDQKNESCSWANGGRLNYTGMSPCDSFHFPVHEEHTANGKDKHMSEYLQPMSYKLTSNTAHKETLPTLSHLATEASSRLDSPSHHPTQHSKPNENYISIEQIDLNYPIEKTNEPSSLADSEAFSNHASSMEDSVFLSNDPSDRRGFEDDAYTRVNVATHPFGSSRINNLSSDDTTDISPSAFHSNPCSGLHSQDYINSTPPLPPKSSHKHLHTRSGSSDQGRVRKEVETHHSKPPLPKRSNYPFSNSSQHASYPFPSPVSKPHNRPYSAKSLSLKHRKPDLTIDTGVHQVDADFEILMPRRPHDAKFSGVVNTGGKIKDVFDSTSLRSTSQDMHQSSPSLATSKPRTGQEYINRCYLNDSQRSPSRGSAFTFDEKPPSCSGYDDNSPLTPSTSSLKSPLVPKPELLNKQHTPSLTLRTNQFIFPSSGYSEKKLNYADIDIIDTSVTATTPALTDHTVYATIDYLATKAVSNISKLHARQT